MTALSIVRTPPTLDDRLTEIVVTLRAAGLRSMAAATRGEQYAAVIVPAPGGPHGYGQYRVIPHDDVLRVYWQHKDRAPVPVDDVDTTDRAAGLIIDHMTGRYP